MSEKDIPFFLRTKMIKAYYTFFLIFNKENGFIRNKLAIF